MCKPGPEDTEHDNSGKGVRNALGQLYQTPKNDGVCSYDNQCAEQKTHLLAYDGEFPLGEAYRLAIGIDAGAGPRRFTLYFVPPRTKVKDHPPMAALLCTTAFGAPATERVVRWTTAEASKRIYRGRCPVRLIFTVR